jgi:hypothetical protein
LSLQLFKLLHVFHPQHIRHLLLPESLLVLAAVRGGGFFGRYYEDFCLALTRASKSDFSFVTFGGNNSIGFKWDFSRILYAKDPMFLGATVPL